MEVLLKNEETNQLTPIMLTDNQDGTYSVEYAAAEPGLHTMTLNYNGLKVPTTPVKFRVVPSNSVDVTKIKVDGLEPSKCLSSYHITFHLYQPSDVYCLHVSSRVVFECFIIYSRPRQQFATI